MTVLIGVIIFILFVIVFYFVLKFKFRRFFNQFGFSGMNLKDVIEEARLEDQEIPKSLGSMDSIYLENIKKDFPNININELKSKAEAVIMDCYLAIEKRDSSSLKGKIKSFVDSKIDDYKDKKIKFEHLKIHKTVVSNYRKEKGTATIYFSTAFQYYLVEDGKSVKVQDRVKLEFIYVIDKEEIPSNSNVLGIHCPNCGSPIKSLGDKNCSYCGSYVIEIIDRVFICNNIVQY